MRLLALAFVLGTAWLQSQAELPRPGLASAGLALLLLGGSVAKRHAVARALAFVAAGALLGAGLAATRAELRLAEALPFAWEGRDIEVSGLVASLPQAGERGTRFAFDVEAVHTPGASVPPRIALTWFAGREKAGAEPEPPPALAAGQRWQWTVRLKRPRGLANPHAFDFEPWALERNLRATGYVRTKPAPRLQAARIDGWPCTLHRWRGEIREAMAAHLGDSRFRGVLVALVIGDQDAIAAEDWQVFWRTGVGHLMSISGLHITMLAGLAFALAAFAWVRCPPLPLWLPARKAAAVAGVLAATAYALLTGFAVPAQRTVLMLAAVAACVLLDRHGSASRVLALAALAVVAADPWAVLSGGFWLSFGAVAAIFYVLVLRTGAPGRLRGAVLEQLAVTVAMLPMLLALFQEVSVVSPLANALAIPAVSLVIVPLSLAGAFPGAAALLDAAHQLMAWLMVPLEALAAWPGAVFESHAPARWTLLAACVGCAWLLAPRGFPLRPLGAAWVAPLVLVVPPSPAEGEAWIDVLDVGHGLAVVVRTAGHALAYDTGPGSSAESDSGNRIVAPYLRGEGVRRLDGLVVSHADDDHSGGAASVAAARSPPWLLSPLAAADPLHADFAYSRLCSAGQSWAWDGVRFEVLHPPDAAHDEPRRRENDRSCVLRVASGNAAVLLTGDIELRSEAEMLARDRAALRAEVLLVPHHGSRTSSTPAFLDAVGPRAAIVSVGHRNRFRHPSEAVLQRYAARAIPVRRTDEEGALRVVLRASGARVERLAPVPRYWSDRGASRGDADLRR